MTSGSQSGVRFLGIDLAWSGRQPSGVAALAPGDGGLEVRALGLALGDDELVAFVRAHRGDATVLMIDAPLVVPNETGRRACEDAVHRLFGRQHAGAHPANRRLFTRLYGGVRGERLLARLAPLGVRLGSLEAAGEGHLAYECFPHPAHLRLFGRSRIFRYKKKGGRDWATVRAEYDALRAALLALDDPPLRLGPADHAALEAAGRIGRAYKACEDRLDALTCAYLAALAPTGRLEMLGSVTDGHIVVPRAGHGPEDPA